MGCNLIISPYFLCQGFNSRNNSPLESSEARFPPGVCRGVCFCLRDTPEHYSSAEVAERRKYLDNRPLNLDLVSVRWRHARAQRQVAHVVGSLQPTFLLSKSLFCLQMSSEVLLVLPGFFVSASVIQGWTQQGCGGGGFRTASQLVLRLRLRTWQGGGGEGFREFRSLIVDMCDGTQHQLTALNDRVNYKMAGC